MAIVENQQWQSVKIHNDNPRKSQMTIGEKFWKSRMTILENLKMPKRQTLKIELLKTKTTVFRFVDF